MPTCGSKGQVTFSQAEKRNIILLPFKDLVKESPKTKLPVQLIKNIIVEKNQLISLVTIHNVLFPELNHAMTFKWQ